MEYKMIFFAAIAALLLVLSGCATIVSPSAHKVRIDSDPPGAYVFLKNESGSFAYVGSTPANVTLPAGKRYFRRERYTVECSYGYQPPQIQTMEYELNPWYLGNFIFGGPLGLFLIDPLTGAMWRPVQDFLFFHFGKGDSTGE